MVAVLTYDTALSGQRSLLSGSYFGFFDGGASTIVFEVRSAACQRLMPAHGLFATPLTPALVTSVIQSHTLVLGTGLMAGMDCGKQRCMAALPRHAGIARA